jgi:hypothetical protein
LGRDHIVEGRQTEAAARSEKDADVLGMTVGGADEPEQNLARKKCNPIADRIVAALKQAHDVNDARTAFVLILPGRRDR